MSVAEEWRPIEGYEGRYEVSDLGRVRSLPRTEHSADGRRIVKGGILRPNQNRDGYLQVGLRKNGRSGKTWRAPVHRLVAVAFHSDARDELHHEVAHLDGNPANARADNIKWVSKAENMAHKRLHGTHIEGERHPHAKLTNQDALHILESGESDKVLAERFGVRPQTIKRIKNRKGWLHITTHGRA